MRGIFASIGMAIVEASAAVSSVFSKEDSWVGNTARRQIERQVVKQHARVAANSPNRTRSKTAKPHTAAEAEVYTKKQEKRQLDLLRMLKRSIEKAKLKFELRDLEAQIMKGSKGEKVEFPQFKHLTAEEVQQIWWETFATESVWIDHGWFDALSYKLVSKDGWKTIQEMQAKMEESFKKTQEPPKPEAEKPAAKKPAAKKPAPKKKPAEKKAGDEPVAA